MDAPLLDAQIAQVNAYADLLATFPLGTSPVRTDEQRALRSAAIAVLEATLGWPKIEQRDGRHVVLSAPDGSLVLYSVERAGEHFVERLTRL
jgi:hypothetical protein